MILPVAAVLTAEQVADIHRRLDAARWVDGAATAGWHARQVKHNTQLALDDAAFPGLRAEIEAALRGHAVVAMAARIKAVASILFSQYEAGMGYGSHVDDAMMAGMRTDLAFTLFLAPPESYEGGELVIEDTAGETGFKLPAGSLLLYPATTLHRVETVTAGRRRAAVGWIRSLVRSPADRELLFDLDTARQALFRQSGKTAEFDLLSKCVSNLLRRWAED
jgi:PKHD-type hydroxylase